MEQLMREVGLSDEVIEQMKDKAADDALDKLLIDHGMTAKELLSYLLEKNPELIGESKMMTKTLMKRVNKG